MGPGSQPAAKVEAFRALHVPGRPFYDAKLAAERLAAAVPPALTLAECAVAVLDRKCPVCASCNTRVGPGRTLS